ncbi:IscS subfamily cysteine desulfurase [Salibacterium halotolerans]|uniref:Cysteine desulfurase n=1 Tax=Salibacterium halotolerans TaxID=1884432 RepID=A0A1I5L561_9BACI|nr:IscS subfamily cysteine desulfurase [Salibacterium halotolerans]SFO92434.1 cysteine desulfurase [Salibacterium halotolerans]
MIYLDHCATTPMSAAALDGYRQAAERFFGNEQSLHGHGEEASHLAGHCRKQLAAIINGSEEGIYFTSGGSDSNITTLLSLAYGRKDHGRHIVTSPFEHPSIGQGLGRLKEEGFTVSVVDVHRNGEICLDSLTSLLHADTILVTICHASSETGVLQPLADIGALLHNHQALLHSDCVQTFTTIPIDVTAAGLDALSLSAHKVQGPKNTGAAYIAPGINWQAVYPGVVHQHGFKPGTLDIPGIASFMEAAVEAANAMDELQDRWRSMQQWLLAQLHPGAYRLFGDRYQRLPHHLALRAVDREGQWIMLECSRRGITISPGSACKTSSSAPPDSLLAMGYTADEAHGLFRISFGRDTTYAELRETASVLNQLAGK